jgi:hypothetical protein
MATMLDYSALKTFRPLFVTPCFGEKLGMNYVLSIIPLQREAIAAGMACDFHFRPGDSLVTRVRNDCVAFFLSQPQYTHLFWIDADIGFSPEAAFRLLLSGHDIAAGVYPLKREDWPAEGAPAGLTRRRFEELYQRYTVNAGRIGGDKVEIVIDRDGFIKVREAPTGFMCVKRGVFDRLIARYPDLAYTPDWPEGTTPQGNVHFRFFDVMVDPESRRYLSEDYGFCRLWEALGGEIYVDANSNLSHSGERTYRGDFGATLRAAPACAVGAPKGQRIIVHGLENLKPNPPG